MKFDVSNIFKLNILFYFICIGLAFAEDEDDVCPTFQDYLNDKGQDLLSGVLKVVTDACANVATKSWDLFATPLQGVVMTGAAIYIAVFTLKNIVSFSQQDAAGYLSNSKTGVIPLMAKVAVVLVLLTSAGNTFLYANLISPVVGAFMNAGSIFGSSPLNTSFDGAGDVNALFSNVLKKVEDFNRDSYRIVALGRELLCLAFRPPGFLDIHWKLIPYGVILFIFGWLICIAISFYMLDVLFRLGVGCMLLPMAVACGVSKLTSQYSKTTWELFVNVCFNFLTLGIVCDFSIKMLTEAVEGTSKSDIGTKLQESAYIEDEVVKELVEAIDFTAVILTILCCFIIFKLFSEIGQLAERVSGAKSVGNTGQKIGADATSRPWNATKRLAKFGGKTIVQEAGSSVMNSKYGIKARAAGLRFKNNVKKKFGLN
ncbi:MAG: hypothetical protein IJZ30_04740 [Alphaproteobacteria bacterium]|nr:hypothetical protein [Alphaproteobacteria bacterium]